MVKLWSADNSALVLARQLLLRLPHLDLQIYLTKERPQDAISFSDFRDSALQSLATAESLAVVSDITEDLNIPASFLSITTELLDNFASRALADSVEFRRLARKYLRKVKSHNCSRVLFLSGVLADEKTQKILKQILGTQIKPLFLSEFLPEEIIKPCPQRNIRIFTDHNKERIHREAEYFLHTKLAQDTVC